MYKFSPEAKQQEDRKSNLWYIEMILMESEFVELSNTEGILYAIPLPFIGKETRVGDKVVSYQLLRLKRSGLFTIEELYTIACLIQERDPGSLINWTATFMLLENDTHPHIRKRLMAMHLA